ncbi:MAG: FAD binding domain-containing protein [bacterium]
MEYYAAVSLKQAEDLKKKIAGSAYFAGGTVLNWRGEPAANALIDLKDLKLGGIKASGGKIIIGASATIQEIAESRAVPKELAKAARCFTGINVRNMATIGGTAAGKFFISNLLPVLAAYNAEVEYYLTGAKKTLPLTDWLKNKKGIVCAIVVGHLKRKVKVLQEKISAMDFPSIVTAMGFELRDGKITKPVVAVSGAGGALSISKKAEVYLTGLKLISAEAGKLSAAALKDIKTTGNVKVSARVKKRIIESHLTSILNALKPEL